MMRRHSFLYVIAFGAVLLECYLYVDAARSKFSEKCDPNATSPCLANMKCIIRGCDGHICVCEDGYMPSEDYSKCITISELKQHCDSTSRCRGIRTRCSDDNLCECLSGYVMADTTPFRQCKQQPMSVNHSFSLLGERCDGYRLFCERQETRCNGSHCVCDKNFRLATEDEINAYPFNELQCVQTFFKLNSVVPLDQCPDLVLPTVAQVTTSEPVKTHSLSTSNGLSSFSLSTTSETNPSSQFTPFPSSLTQTVSSESLESLSNMPSLSENTYVTLSITPTSTIYQGQNSDLIGSPVTAVYVTSTNIFSSMKSDYTSPTSMTNTLEMQTSSGFLSTSVYSTATTSFKGSAKSSSLWSNTYAANSMDELHPTSVTETDSSVYIMMQSSDLISNEVTNDLNSASQSIAIIPTSPIKTSSKSSSSSSSMVPQISKVVTTMVDLSQSLYTCTTCDSSTAATIAATTTTAATTATTTTTATTAAAAITTTAAAAATTAVTVTTPTAAATITTMTTNNFSTTSPPRIGGNCTKGDACPLHSVCKEKCRKWSCYCSDGYVPTGDHLQCVPLVNLGKTCISDNQCIGPNTQCRHHVCTCSDGYEQTKDRRRCRRKSSWLVFFPLLHDTCGGFLAECYNDFEQVCSGGSCECKSGLREITQNDSVAYPKSYAQCRNSSFPSGFKNYDLCVGPPHESDPSAGEGDRKVRVMIAAIIGGVFGVILLIVIAIGIVCFVRRKRRSMMRDMTKDNVSDTSFDRRSSGKYSFRLPRPFVFSIGEKDWEAEHLSVHNSEFEPATDSEQLSDTDLKDSVSSSMNGPFTNTALQDEEVENIEMENKDIDR